MIRLAIFDLDGTLVDSRQDLYEAVNHALRVVGLPERTFEEVAAFVGDGARTLMARSVSPHQQLLEPALAAWHQHYGVHLLDHTTLFPGLQEVLQAARCQLAVQTNKPGALARRILEGLGVRDRFAIVLGGDDVPRKPDPTGTLQIMSQLGVAPNETLFVGDSPIDCATAQAAGTQLVAVTWGQASASTLAQAGATKFVNHTAELGSWLGSSSPGTI